MLKSPIQPKGHKTMRYNRKFIQARFEMAMDAIGAPHGATYTKTENGYRANVGVHFIDHAACYGGYTIRRISNESGGESEVFGSNRHNASAFVALLDGILGAARIMGERA